MEDNRFMFVYMIYSRKFTDIADYLSLHFTGYDEWLQQILWQLL